MNSQPESSEIQRYIALDIHKEYVMLGAMNSSQEWVIRPRRVEKNILDRIFRVLALSQPWFQARSRSSGRV